MCGIVGYIGQGRAPILLEGLQRLEYRGYDSAGVAVGRPGQAADAQGQGPGRPSWRRTCPSASPGRPASATPAGPPTARRATPTPTRTCRPDGRSPSCTTASSRTPTSCGPSWTPTASSLRLRDRHRGAGPPDRPRRRGRPRGGGPARRCAEIVGTYGIAVLDTRAAPTAIVVARNGSPVVLGIGEKEMFVASDVAALVRHTRQVVHLDDGEIAILHGRRLPHLHHATAR